MADPDRGVMGSFVRIEDGDGVLLPGTPGGPATLGLVNFGVEDGQEAVPSVRPELGTFTHPRAKKGPVRVALVPDSSAASEVDALAKQIISLVDAFKSEMETALLPWMTAWNRQGLLSIPAAYRTGKMKGFNAWWEGEVGFWASVGDWISSAFDAAAQALLYTASEFWDWYVDLPWYDRLNPLGAYARQALEALFENAKDLWEQRDQIMALVKGFATGSIDAIEKSLEALVDIPGEIGELARLLVDKSAEWTGGLIEMIRETDVVEKLAAATFAIIMMMMPPNLWAEAIGAVEGLLPEVLIAAVFAIIAACTDGAGASFCGAV
ncbi:hypothetical protein TH25_05885 [Thalassospira profundimaris]|uniref:Uncharacterized protein n=1 Tax=Thalassospira profundimaris TaxID=502049 RepID=A0A367XG04_9PROT|nr:hypothetical protein [Thalassospira profundimaris]RCK52567.1 hypothetical protein TH25_05885 [Thalassospira profundimaris]